jgi:hypothetical protein
MTRESKARIAFLNSEIGIAHKIFTGEKRADIFYHFGPRRLAAPWPPHLLEEA